jgi:hypothetical protein
VILPHVTAKVVAASVIDPDTGEPMFSLGDVELLGKQGAGVLARIVEVANRLNLASKDAVADAKKDSRPTRNDETNTP